MSAIEWIWVGEKIDSHNLSCLYDFEFEDVQCLDIRVVSETIELFIEIDFIRYCSV